MTSGLPVIAVVGCAAGGLERLREALVEPLLSNGYRVAVTVTPTAATWLGQSGEAERIALATGLPVRSEPRMPTGASPHPTPDVVVVAPASANTVAKLALGVADNQALTAVNESMGLIPVIVFPRVNAAHARHPAWQGHIEVLRAAGVHLVYGDGVWPLHEPRSRPDRELPWAAILAAVDEALPTANL